MQLTCICVCSHAYVILNWESGISSLGGRVLHCGLRSIPDSASIIVYVINTQMFLRWIEMIWYGMWKFRLLILTRKVSQWHINLHLIAHEMTSMSKGNCVTKICLHSTHSADKQHVLMLWMGRLDNRNQALLTNIINDEVPFKFGQLQHNRCLKS